jgi:hypothetical protein
MYCKFGKIDGTKVKIMLLDDKHGQKQNKINIKNTKVKDF